MTAIEKSATVLINRPLAEVFNFVADPGKFPLWQPFVIAAEITSKGSIAVGATYSYSFKAMGQVIETSGVITEYQPFSRFSYKSTSGPFLINGGYRFVAKDRFVEVTAYGSAETEGYFAIANAMIGLVLGRQLNTMLQTLKETLEGRG